MKRVIEENVVSGELIVAALALLRASRFGLYESELVELLAIEPVLPPGTISPQIKFKIDSSSNRKQTRITTQIVNFNHNCCLIFKFINKYLNFIGRQQCKFS